jgi:hypothetical protein
LLIFIDSGEAVGVHETREEDSRSWSEISIKLYIVLGVLNTGGLFECDFIDG